MPLETQMQKVIDQFTAFGAPPIETLSPENARNMPTLKNAVEELPAESLLARTMTLAKPMPEPVGRVSHVLIPGPAGPLLARVFRPDVDDAAQPPVIVYFHGGGWVIANLDVYEPSCRALCNAVEAIVVSVAYRQAPEHPFPAAVEDAHAALQWVIANASILGGDPTRVMVAGESAGGNLATVACRRSRDAGQPLPIAQLLVYPVTDASMSTASYRENSDAKPLNAAMMPWFWKHYTGGDARKALEPDASPINTRDLSGLPPATIITAELDPLRDEGEAYAQRLEEAGVDVAVRRFDGVPHEFFGLAGVSPTAKQALEFAAERLKDAAMRDAGVAAGVTAGAAAGTARGASRKRSGPSDARRNS